MTARCLGDCNGDGVVTADELVLGIDVSLGRAPADACAAYNAAGGSLVTVDQLVRAVQTALDGCR